LCNELQLNVPAHYDDMQKKYVIDCSFPAHFDAQAKHWLLEDGPCSWDDVMKRWKARGPMNEAFVGMVQRGKREMLRLLEQDA
jgi:ring-1,2-phenylacetyl-CoA epoxidase subunit PaaA